MDKIVFFVLFFFFFLSSVDRKEMICRAFHQCRQSGQLSNCTQDWTLFFFIDNIV